LFPECSGLPLLEAVKGKEKNTEALRIGAIFSGGPAAGGHNVLAGLFDALEGGTLVGFLGGPVSLVKGHCKELSKADVDAYRNLGGFDLLGSGRDKIETEEQMKAALDTCTKLDLDGLVIVGGDDSNTNAAVLAEFFKKYGSKTKVIGVPKTIDGDLQNEHVSISFGFDTATKVYAELIGNICKDAASARKYTHFIRLMGRSASHVTLECALATRPNAVLIGEEIHRSNTTLSKIISDIADLICLRSEAGKDYGVIVIPEGLVEFIPEISSLLKELNMALAKEESPSSHAIIASLSRSGQKCFESLPEPIRKQLLLSRDPHGNVQVSLIETEKLLAELVGVELGRRKAAGLFTGKFHPMTHFFGYEGRCAIPSDFDANYCYCLGTGAALLLRFGVSGYMTFVSNLHLPVENWHIGGVPLTSLMGIEMRKGKSKPVIQKAGVSLEGKPFIYLLEHKEGWGKDDCYLSPGPTQYCNNPAPPLTLSLRFSGKGEKR